MSVFSEALVAAVNAMLKVLLVIAIGIISAHLGFLNTTFIPQLSGWVFSILLPAMMISNLGKQLSIEKLGLYWPLILWATYTIAIGYLIGYLYTTIFRQRKEYKSTLLSAVAYNNSLSLPIVILDSLCASALFADSTAESLAQFQQASAMCFVISIPWNLIMFIIGYPHLLDLQVKNDGNNDEKSNGDDSDPNINPNIPLTDDNVNLSGIEMNNYALNQSDSIQTLAVIQDDDQIEEYEKIVNQIDTNVHPLDISIENDPKYPPVFLMSFCAKTSFHANRNCDKFCTLFNQHFLAKLPTKLRFVLVMMFTNPPLVSIFIAIFLSLIPPIKRPLYDSKGELNFVIKALEFIAQASIPLSTLVTAANIYHSINRNYGRDARSLARIFSLVEEVQKDMVEKGDDYDLDHDDKHHNNGQNGQNGQDNHDLAKINNHNIELSPPQSLNNHYLYNGSDGEESFTSNNNDYMMRQPSSLQIALRQEYLTQKHNEQFKSPQQLNVIRNNQSSLGYFDPSHSLNSISSLNHSPSTLKVYHTVASQSKYLMPMSSDMASTGMTDMQNLVKNYSTLDTKAISPFNPNQTAALSQKRLTVGNLAVAKQTALTRLFAKIDPNLPIDFDHDGSILPLPRLGWVNMLLVSICRLIFVPLILYLTMLLIDGLGWTILLPDDRLYRTVILLCGGSTTAEIILMIITKGFKVRQSMMLSLIYVLQYGMCLITIPIWLVIVISANQNVVRLTGN
jgi:predicted permease